MSKFKTVNSTGKIVSFQGQLRLLAEKNGWLQRVEVRLLNSDLNRNGWIYQNLDEHRHLFAKTPLLCAYVGDKVGDGHNFSMRKDEKEGKEVPDFTAPDAERIVGYFANDEDIRIEYIDGKKWIVGVGTIFSWYNRQLVEKLKERGELSVSIETLIDEMHYEGKTEVFTKYQILGTTILNEKVNPAVVGANIKTLQFKGDIQEFTMRVASFDEQQLGLPNEPQTQKQNQNSEKGVTRTMAKVRKIDDLRSLFPNHTVLGVKGQSVALLNEKGRCCSYTFQENENTVVPERIEEIAVNSVFGEGENAINISAEELVGSVQAQLNSTKTALDKATAENAELTAKINAMTEAEYLRRKKVVERAIRETFDDNRRQYDGDIDEHFVDDLLTDECLSNYARMEDKDGFCGENAARTEVDARCMRKLREVNKARQNTAKPKYAWELGGEGYEDKPESGINTAIDNILKD
jgi:hypothetical protein